MDDKPNIYQRMLAVMRDISYVQKSDKTVNNQYRFVTHDAVTAKVRTALIEHGIVATADVTAHRQDGNRTEVDVRVTFINVDTPADCVTINAFGYGIDPQDKGPGKAVSYAVKYAYLKAFALETGDDPERDSIEHAPAAAAAPRPISGAQVAKDALDAMSDEAQAYIKEYAAAVLELFNSNGDVMGYLQAHTLDAEEKLALWSLLPSNVRSAIKKSQQETRAAA